MDLPRFCCARSLAMEEVYRRIEPYMERYGGDDATDEHYASWQVCGRVDGGANPVARPAAFVDGMRCHDIDGIMCLHGEKDGIEACAIFMSGLRSVRDGSGKRRMERYLATKERVVNAYLVGMPISLDYISGGDDDVDYDGSGGGGSRSSGGKFRRFNVLVVRINDERRYRPTADRERFDAESERRIIGVVDEILAERLAAVRWPATLAEHLRGPYRAAMDLACDAGETLGTGSPTWQVPEVGEREAAMCMLGRTPVRNGFARHSMPLYHELAARPRSVMASNVDARRIMAVARHDPTVKVIVTGKAGELAESGIEGIDDYMKRVGIEPLTGEEIAAYEKSEAWGAVRASYGSPYVENGPTYGGARCSFYTATGEALEGTAAIRRNGGRIRTNKLAGIVVARSRLGAIVGAMRASGAPYAVASIASRSGADGRGGGGKGAKGGDGGAALVRGVLWPAPNPGDVGNIAGYGESDDDEPPIPVIPEDDFLAAASSATYATSYGDMTGGDIAHRNGRIAIMQYDGEREECGLLAAAIGRSAWFGVPGTLYAVCSEREHFALVALLGATAASLGGGGKGGPLSTERVVRLLALNKVPDCERRKNMVPAGRPVLLGEEIGACAERGGRHARLAATTTGGWMVQMDLLLASLLLANADVLAAIAGSAPAFSHSDRRSGGDTMRLRDLIDGALEAEAALAAAPPRREPPVRHIGDFDRRHVDASSRLLSRGRRWIVRGCQRANIEALPRATMADVAACAAGRTYHTNNGPMTGADIVRDCAKARGGGKGGRGDDGSGRYIPPPIAADIVVYGKDPAGLAAAIPPASSSSGRNGCSGRMLAVAASIDDAIELGSAIASAGLFCCIGGEGDSIKDGGHTRRIMEDAVPRKVRSDMEPRGKYGDADWRDFPCAWHGLLTVRNTALRVLLGEALDVYNAGGDEFSAFEALVDRFRWLDGQRPCGGGDRGNAGTGPGKNGGTGAATAAGQAASRAEPANIMAPGHSGAPKRGD